ncbi:hypothetical protein, partial [Mesorhizobium sp.]|uniref:hypothetical protein n=1 Tax=Mesorhizobium sp. TaxID=1871066 RepID=UPI0025F7F4F0
SRGRDDRLQALTVAGRNGEGDAIAHASNSHATPQNGIPKSDSFDPINPLGAWLVKDVVPALEFAVGTKPLKGISAE